MVRINLKILICKGGNKLSTLRNKCQLGKMITNLTHDAKDIYLQGRQ
jgi:hypothetical protein